MLLLRRAVYGLRGAGHEVTLLAPEAPGSALVGAGPSEAQRLLSWDRADVASLLSAEGPKAGSFAEALAGFETAIAYTRSHDLLRNLARQVPNLLGHDPSPPGSEHVSRWLARPLALLGLPPRGEPPPCLPSPREAARAEAFCGDLPPGFLAVHPGSGSSSKNWPDDRFGALADALARGRFLLVEGIADEAATARLRPRKDAVLARSLPARILGAVLSRAGIFVGNDSGVSHLAAAFGAPTVALFGPTDPEVWAPVGPRVVTLRSPSGSLDGITVEEVLAAAASVRRDGGEAGL